MLTRMQYPLVVEAGARTAVRLDVVEGEVVASQERDEADRQSCPSRQPSLLAPQTRAAPGRILRRRSAVRGPRGSSVSATRADVTTTTSPLTYNFSRGICGWRTTLRCSHRTGRESQPRISFALTFGLRLGLCFRRNFFVVDLVDGLLRQLRKGALNFMLALAAQEETAVESGRANTARNTSAFSLSLALPLVSFTRIRTPRSTWRPEVLLLLSSVRGVTVLALILETARPP